MTGICGLIGREADDLEPKGKTILSLMRNRGSESRTFSQTVPGGEKIIIGVCDLTGGQSFAHQAVPLALDGVFFGDDARPDKPGPAGPSRLIQTPGAFAFLTLLQDQLFAGRDIIGQKPLYFGQVRDGAVAFASLRSPLATIGIREPKPVPPGKVIRASAQRYEMVSDYSLKQPKEEPTSQSDATRTLDKLFNEAVGRIVPRGSGIAFSGGLDSALVAHVAKSAGLEPELISVGLKGQQELDHAERTAKSFGLRVEIRELSSSEILNSLPDVIEIIETTDPVIVGISVPIYFACQKAHKMGLNYIAAGQLSDGDVQQRCCRFRKGLRPWRQARGCSWPRTLFPLRVSSTCRVRPEATCLSPSQSRQWKGDTKIYSEKSCCSPAPPGKCGRPAQESCPIFQRRPEGFVERSKATGDKPRQDAGILHEIVCRTYPRGPLCKRGLDNGKGKPRESCTPKVTISGRSRRVLQPSHNRMGPIRLQPPDCC